MRPASFNVSAFTLLALLVFFLVPAPAEAGPDDSPPDAVHADAVHADAVHADEAEASPAAPLAVPAWPDPSAQDVASSSTGALDVCTQTHFDGSDLGRSRPHVSDAPLRAEKRWPRARLDAAASSRRDALLAR